MDAKHASQNMRCFFQDLLVKPDDEDSCGIALRQGRGSCRTTRKVPEVRTASPVGSCPKTTDIFYKTDPFFVYKELLSRFNSKTNQ